METLKAYDVAQYDSVKMVIAESDLLPPDPAIVVIPLLSDYPVIQWLNPIIDFDGQNFVLATRLITSVRRQALRHVGSVGDQRSVIVRAIDVLLGGV